MRYDHINMLPANAFKRVGKIMTLEGGKSDPPPAPDYTSAANATAQGNLEAARAAAAANRVNQVTPNGNLTYTHSGTGDDGWTATQTLSPAQQQMLNKNNTLSNGLLDTAQLGLSGVNDALSKGFDWNALPASQVNAGQTAQDAIMSRLTPQFNNSEDALRTKLVNQGLTPGSTAWDNEMNNFNYGKNDAYSQAALQGIGVGQQARAQALQEQEFGRTEGLNMVNALRTGNQVQQPNFVNTPQQATTAGADLLGATNAGYQNQLSATNASNANSAGLFGGLVSAAGNAASAYFL
jgi:hypothetical protein